MNRKVLALLALAAFGLSAGASFDAYAYNRYDCLLECRAEYDEHHDGEQKEACENQ